MTVKGLTGLLVMAAGIALTADTALAQTAAAAPARPATQAKPAAQAKTGSHPAKPPAAVEAAFRKAYPEARIKNVTHETEEGQEQYEIESIDHGMELDVNFKPDGTLIVEEREVAASEVPEAVTSAIFARYPKATLLLRERVTESGSTSYEITLKGAAVKSVQLTPEGKWISPKPVK